MFSEIANKTFEKSRSKISRIFGISLKDFLGDFSKFSLDDFILVSHGFQQFSGKIVQDTHYVNTHHTHIS